MENPELGRVHSLVFAYCASVYDTPIDLINCEICIGTADTICGWQERAVELSQLNNWLSQESSHVAYAMTYMFAEDEKYMSATEIPIPVMQLVQHQPLRDILCAIVGAISDM